MLENLKNINGEEQQLAHKVANGTREGAVEVNFVTLFAFKLKINLVTAK